MRIKKVVLVVALAFSGWTFIHPPTYVKLAEDTSQSAFLWNFSFSERVDYTRLIMQLGAIASFAGIAYVLADRRSSTRASGAKIVSAEVVR